MEELLGKILTGLITALATLTVCLINNAYQSKRDKAAREQKDQEHLSAIQTTYTAMLSDVKTDYSTQITNIVSSLGELKRSISDLCTKNDHQFELLNMKIETLSEKQSAYNNLQARTYHNETDIKVIKALLGDTDGK